MADRRRRQRGSILSGLLIIVALLSILIGGLTTELSSSFLVSRAMTARMSREASVNAAVELTIHQLQTGTVPAVCVRDNRGPWFLTLNSMPTTASQSCTAIVPDAAVGLVPGSFAVDGTHDLAGGRDMYVLSDSSGRLAGYRFGQTVPRWSTTLSGTPTGTPLTTSNQLLIPLASAASGCRGTCVAAYGYNGSSPGSPCYMAASGPVTGEPAIERPVGGQSNFGYVFFGDSGGSLYVYDAADGCSLVATGHTGAASVGAMLVFPDRVTTHGHTTTTSDELFLFVTDSSGTSLQRWRYSETTDSQNCEDNDCVIGRSLSLVQSTALLSGGAGAAVGYAASAAAPSASQSLTLAVATFNGGIAKARISVTSGLNYSMSAGGATTLAGGVDRAPRWCQCPNPIGDVIGVGSRNGFLYLLDPNLNLVREYDGAADGRPAIRTTPVADANGEWYFGADDGYVYDVEVPAAGIQMFKAARFGPGGAIRSSPIAGGPADGCSPNVCMYFASSTQGSYFAQIGNTRTLDLRACVSSAPGSVQCAANPRLWARVTVGPGSNSAKGVSVQGWSYYSP